MKNDISDALRKNDELPDIRNTIEEMILKSHLSNKAALTVDECALYTGMAKSYIYKLTHEGIIPHSKPNGKKIFFDRLELDQWLLGNKIKSERSLGDFIKKTAESLNKKASINYR